MDSKFLPWTEKYRPQSLENVVSHTNIINSIKIFVKLKFLPNLLFYGPPGTGKTSTVIAAAKELFGIEYYHRVMELNASDHRGIGVIREQISEFCSSKIHKSQTIPFNLVILDEIDAMTKDAQLILIKVIEQFSNSTRFCLVCNYVQKLIQPLQSRCVKLNFCTIEYNNMYLKLNEIAKNEGSSISNKSVKLIKDISGGDMRKAINILQSTFVSKKNFDSISIMNCICYPKKDDILKILDSLIFDTFENSFYLIRRLIKEKYYTINDISTELFIILNWVILDNDYIWNEFPISDNDVYTIIKLLAKHELVYQNIIVDIRISSLIACFNLKKVD